MIAAIVQARMTSHRFPGKVMHPLMGKPVLQHVLRRALAIPSVQKVVCAFPDDEASEPILELCREMRVIAFAGDELDVLSRYYEAAKSCGATVIMRITADCPFIDPFLCELVLKLFEKENLDYCSNVHPHRTFPKGLDCEAFTFNCLEAAHSLAVDEYDREHVTPWMQRTPGLLVGNVTCKQDESDANYCIDYPGDIERLEAFVREKNAN
jgi:spore coat polysaccharide biosynthesis protein SpsF (cytidylyltransferase family)